MRLALGPLALIAIGSLALGGCGGNSYTYVGFWLGHRKLTPKPGTDPHVIEEASRLALTIKDDGTFTMYDAGMKKDGRFDVEGGKGVLNVERLMDQPMGRQAPDIQARNVPITLTPIDKNSLKYFDPTGYDADGLVLERQTPDAKPSSAPSG